MTFATYRFAFAALLLVTTGFGCASISAGSDCENGGECKPPKRYSDEWYAMAADRPVGSRQWHKKGKLWPPYPRPTGEQQEFSHRYHAAHYWPYPYFCQDRRVVREMAAHHAAKGWMNTTTLYDYHFDPVTHELDHSGRLQLRWILENAAPQHRVIWVQAGYSKAISDTRVGLVRAETIEMVGDSHIPPIMLRVVTPHGRPALEIDAIRQAEIASMPEPRVEYRSLPSGSGE
jgi:hypothetical protein